VSPVADSAGLFVVAGAGYLAFGSVATAALVHFAGARLTHWEPRARHRALVAIAALPILFAVGMVFATSLPSLVALVAPRRDHCPVDHDGHAHLCFVHLPSGGVPVGVVALLGLVAGYFAVRAAVGIARVVRALRVATTLAETGVVRRELDATIVESERPLCLTVGLVRPSVILSRGLVDALAPGDRAIVVAHERAHVRRRDALVTSLVRALAALHVPRVGRWLVEEIETAAEQACDEDAANTIGDRVAVAEAILAVERVACGAAAHSISLAAVAMGARAIERRVRALLEEPLPRRSLQPFAFGTLLAFFALLTHADELHHATEFALALLAR